MHDLNQQQVTTAVKLLPSHPTIVEDHSSDSHLTNDSYFTIVTTEKKTMRYWRLCCILLITLLQLIIIIQFLAVFMEYN